MRERPALALCFAPHMAMFFGAFLAWLSMFLVTPAIEFVPILGRVQAVTFSIAFWSIFQAYARGLELWGGGTIAIVEAQRPRLHWLVGTILVAILSALMLFIAQQFKASAILTALLLTFMLSEIGWGSPWVLVTGRARDEASVI